MYKNQNKFKNSKAYQNQHNNVEDDVENKNLRHNNSVRDLSYLNNQEDGENNSSLENNSDDLEKETNNSNEEELEKENQPRPRPRRNITPQNIKAKIQGFKKVLGFLLKHKVVLIIAVIMIFIFGLLILVSLDMLTGKGSSNSSDGGTSQSYSEACDAINISKTTLSKTEFVSKVQDYYTGSTSSAAKVFSDNAGTIYDIATNNNINPEMVIVRAVSEGHSPGGSTNNYWGIGCTNTGGYDACHKYSSFSEGVLAYVENISQYDSVSSMMSKYAYIGQYWYNPGGSGVGGCYYYPYIKEYLTPSRSSTVASACSTTASKCSTGGGSGCVKTTSEDQLAYSKWQVFKMAGSRQTIFGIGPDSCDSNSEGCTIYAQGDSKWKSKKLGKSSETMGASGCAVTSIAIGISCSGTEIYLDNFNAGTFLDELNKGDCFTSSGGIYWGCQKISEIANVKHADTQVLSGKTESEKNEKINSYDLSNHFIILHFKNSDHPRGHWVIYTETSGSNYVTKDPAGGKVSNVKISEVDRIVVYSF